MSKKRSSSIFTSIIFWIFVISMWNIFDENDKEKTKIIEPDKPSVSEPLVSKDTQESLNKAIDKLEKTRNEINKKIDEQRTRITEESAQEQQNEEVQTKTEEIRSATPKSTEEPKGPVSTGMKKL